MDNYIFLRFFISIHIVVNNCYHLLLLYKIFFKTKGHIIDDIVNILLLTY